MRNSENVFHLAIPCADLDATHHFYVDQLGCRMARRYDDRITLDFFGDQVVCHLAPDKVVSAPEMYPRHFGVTFRDAEDWHRLVKLAQTRGLTFFEEPFHRFEGRVEEHESFMLQDPSGNLLEFKYYIDPRMMY